MKKGRLRAGRVPAAPALSKIRQKVRKVTMNMKKKVAPLLAAALVAANAVPVLAAENLEVSDAQQSGNTTVTANVNEIDSGNVTYTISVPSKVDFGDLQRSVDMVTENNKERTGEVKLTAVDDLDTTTQRVAVLVQDAENGTEGFKIYGASDAALNNGKELNYDILAGSPDQQDLISTTVYTNGFLIGAFQNQDDIVPMTFRLNQNQMTGELDQWAGTYEGTLTFYSKVSDVNDYN